eukprot:SAG22_NODE_73_length_22318_cov_47.105315_26_plen_207_part_00
MSTSRSVGMRRLFRPDGPLVSEIGFGAWPIGGAFGEVARRTGIETVQAAVRLGASFIDTADYYENAPEYGSKTNSQGGSETVIGLALKEDSAIGSAAFVTTKASRAPFTDQQIRATHAKSAAALQTETIPLYQLHRYDNETPIDQQMGTLKALQDEGKISYIGLNNTTLENLQAAWATGVRFHTLQIRYSMFSRRYVEAEILPWCR